TLRLKQKRSVWSAFKNFLVEGIWHIWIGYDHILFLMMLLIPSVYYYRDGRPLPRRRFRDVLIEVLKVVTGFSVAHSITLGLSVGDVVHLNSQFVEVAIALSVLFTAVNNLYPMITRHAWIMAFMFGLIHGFGFANVLHDLIIKNSQDFLAMLFGFNLGVEIGQLAIVAAVLPLLYLLEKTTFYKRFILYGFSALTAVIAALWAVERAFNLSILPF
ncbi:MAG: HupE/UreJ family protein, partial [Sulfurospirillum sp.]